MKNIDVIQILNFGVIGLGFLLAFMAYNLLSKEQKKEQPSKLVLNSISTFMKFSIVMAVIGLSGELVRGFLSHNYKNGISGDISGNEIGVAKDGRDKYPLDYQVKITSTDIKNDTSQFDKATDLVEISKSEFKKICLVVKSRDMKFGRKIIYSWRLFDAAGNLKNQYATHATPESSNWVLWVCDEDFTNMNNGNYKFEVEVAGNIQEKSYRLID